MTRSAGRRLLALVLCLCLSPLPALAVPAASDAGLGQQSAQGQQFFDGRGVIGNALSTPSPVEEGSAGGPASGQSALQPSSAVVTPARQDIVASPETAAPQPAAPRKPSRLERFESALFTISWWGYHATWAADTFVTGYGISHGLGYEADHLYTQFGNRNVAGVVGSLTAGHILASGLSMYLHKKAKKRHGLAHHLLEGAAIAVNVAGMAAHVSGFMSWVPLL